MTLSPTLHSITGPGIVPLVAAGSGSFKSLPGAVGGQLAEAIDSSAQRAENASRKAGNDLNDDSPSPSVTRSQELPHV